MAVALSADGEWTIKSQANPYRMKFTVAALQLIFMIFSVGRHFGL
jgi:hypothetical protein